MILERTANAARNFFQGILNKVVTLLFPFIVQTIMVRTLGIEYLGIKSLFASILTVLNLSELGIGVAVAYSMYKPIAQDDTESICALLNLYRKLYRIIGIIILTAGLMILPFLPYLVKDKAYPGDINIYITYMLYLINTVISYWLFAYKSSVLNAYQRTDITSIISSIVQIGMNIAQIGVLLLTKKFYLFLVVSIIFTIINNLLISYNVDRLFPNIRCAGKVSKETLVELKRKVAGLMIGKVCAATRNTFDSIFLSVFLGLEMTAIYNNYYCIINSLTGLMLIIHSSLQAGVGNSIQLDSRVKNFQDMKKLDFIYMLIAGWMAICIACLSQPFMKIWMGDGLMLPDMLVILLALYFYIMKMGDMRGLYSDAAGLFWEHRRRTLAEAVANIILNYLLVKLWGIYGIVLATIVTLFFLGFLCSARVTFRYYFKEGMGDYLLGQLKYFLVTAVNFILVYIICMLFSGNKWFVLCGKALVCCIICPLFYLLVYVHTRIFQDTKKWIQERKNYLLKR